MENWEKDETKFVCPYCGHEYQRLVTSGTVFKYKREYYNNETCINCGKEFLYRRNIYVKMPENTDELGYRGYWIS